MSGEIGFADLVADRVIVVSHVQAGYLGSAAGSDRSIKIDSTVSRASLMSLTLTPPTAILMGVPWSSLRRPLFVPRLVRSVGLRTALSPLSALPMALPKISHRQSLYHCKPEIHVARRFWTRRPGSIADIGDAGRNAGGAGRIQSQPLSGSAQDKSVAPIPGQSQPLAAITARRMSRSGRQRMLDVLPALIRYPPAKVFLHYCFPLLKLA